ncbi:hypothetical protein [Cupriavidus sp. DL-D2]|uniref:hypothetical protein n=1 Tax=Cupriavidus sp. DL-D2 TaxID=3144974 RepID=UPI003211FE2A
MTSKNKPTVKKKMPRIAAEMFVTGFFDGEDPPTELVDMRALRRLEALARLRADFTESDGWPMFRERANETLEWLLSAVEADQSVLRAIVSPNSKAFTEADRAEMERLFLEYFVLRDEEGKKATREGAYAYVAGEFKGEGGKTVAASSLKKSALKDVPKPPKRERGKNKTVA